MGPPGRPVIVGVRVVDVLKDREFVHSGVELVHEGLLIVAILVKAFETV